MQNSNEVVPPSNDHEAVQPSKDNGQSAGINEASQARGNFDLRGNRGKKQKPKSFYYTLAGLLLLGVCGLGGIWAAALNEISSGSSKIDESKVKADATLDSRLGGDDGMAAYQAQQAKKLREADEARKHQSQKPPAEPAKPTSTTGPTAQAPSPATGKSQDPAPMSPGQRKLGGGVFVKSGMQNGTGFKVGSVSGQSQTSSSSSPPRAAPSVLDTPGIAGLDANASLDSAADGSNRASLDNLGGTKFTPTKAVLAPNGKYLLRHNTYARCVLYTEIITSNPGAIECRLTDPLYSADGSTVIAEAGARMEGQQKVAIEPGAQNVFTSWTGLDTANGGFAPLNSLGAGPMGASGTAAWIDHHYAEKYTGAVALTFTQDFLSAAANSTQRSNSGLQFNNSEQNVENMASKALDSSINIKDTGYILPGTVMTVIIVRDIDFSTVFENR